MTEPEDLTLALIGDLADNDPWDVELWCRDGANANPGSIVRWHRAGTCDPERTQRLSWDRLVDRAATSRRALSIVTPTRTAMETSR